MGNRVSIQFKNSGMKYASESVVLFHHWGGQKFADFAKDWALKLKEDVKKFSDSKGHDPLTRLEPRNIMVQFIKCLGGKPPYGTPHEHQYCFFNAKTGRMERTNEFLTHSLYFGKDENDGDNSDNGHHVIELS
mgnify:FL=1|jgi:hypothetical protein